MASERDDWSKAGRLLAQCLDELGAVSEEPGQLTRTFLSAAMKQANEKVGRWMTEAGLSVVEDAAGNLIGRLQASTVPDRAAKTLVLGSHLDTVRNAGRFDGALGVLLPIVAVAELRRRGVALPFAVEVVGFSEEEGVRFSTPYIGSKYYAGKLRSKDLACRDTDGLTVQQAMANWANANSRAARRISADRLLGYLEVHIEQGPVLEAEGLAVGTVTAIASQCRGCLRFDGKAGHAGTTPMRLRRDAIAGAAEFILAAEKLAQSDEPLLATIGVINVPGAAGNVIAAECTVSLDVRHPSAPRCRAAVQRLVQMAKAIAAKRGLRCEWKRTLEQPATACSRSLSSVLAASVRAVQGRDLPLVSGAGHDAVVIAELTGVAMLFVRCRDGLSHHPDEYASPRDLTVALRVVVDFIQRLAQRHASLLPGARRPAAKT